MMRLLNEVHENLMSNYLITVKLPLSVDNKVDDPKSVIFLFVSLETKHFIRSFFL